jgi:NAD(P)-dependent dehydrogenase (short-subunit alcohol dehydrogenase family)
LAVDLGKYNIRVNTLAPGAVRTNLGRNDPPRPIPATAPTITAAASSSSSATAPPTTASSPSTAQPPTPAQEIRRPMFPLGRVGMPEDMGDAVACLVSDAFRYMTGSTVLIDGGLMLRNV